MTVTRRTHIVRCYADPNDTSSDFVDVEVLDAIAFRTTRNKEVILNMPGKDAVPYIKDDTGGNHEKTPPKATQRSHMKRVKSSDGSNALDVEILDCWGARSKNNFEFILDMQSGADGSNDFNISDGSGSAKSTRRVHNEIVSSPPGKTKDEAGQSYVTSVRSDNIAFRKFNGKEVIFSMPSCDDTNAQGVNFGRADTHMTPEGYDPSDDSDTAIKPPSLEDSGDQHNYVKFVDDGSGGFKAPFTADEKIEMGPLWWIRKVSSGGTLLFITIDSGGFQGSFNATFDFSGSLGKYGAEPNAQPLSLVDFTSDSDQVKLIGYVGTFLEFTASGETLIFSVPKTGDFKITIHGQNPMEGYMTAAIYNSKSKLASIFSAATTGAGGAVVSSGTPTNGSDTHPPEVDPGSITWAFPTSAAHEYTSGDPFQKLWGTDPGVPSGTLTQALKTGTDGQWTRTTKFYQAGTVDGYDTVIHYSVGLNTTFNGAGFTFDTNVTFKGGKLNIATVNTGGGP